MTTLQLPVIPILFQHYKPLIAPILQHLAYGVVVHIGTLYRNRMLHSLLVRELNIQSFKDGVIFSTLLSPTVYASCIVATHERILYAVSEEI